MAGKSNYLESALLGWIKGTAFPAAPTNTYIALFTTAPTDSGGGTEVSGGSYARVAIASSGWSSISGGGASPEQISNGSTVTFATATANWGVITAVGLYDAASGGNLLYWSTISSQTISTGDIASFAVGALVVSDD